MKNRNVLKTKNIFDVKVGNIHYKIKHYLADIRSLRHNIIEIVYNLSSDLKIQSSLILFDPKITESRIREEWKNAERVLLPNILERLNIVIYRKGQYSNSIKPLSEKDKTLWDEKEIIKKNKAETGLPRPNLYYEILKILILRWMKKEGPISSNGLSEIAGCSYPTIAEARNRLGKSIETYSDRKFKLKNFPYEEWKKLLVESDKIRSTMWFADKSGLKPRNPESLLKRFKKDIRDDIAIGGVFGAVNYLPDLDITGSPRLDLTIHCQENNVNLNFIQNLDPALERVDKIYNGINLVIHFIRRKESFFVKDSNSINWVDPVECLLDLQEEHLESQAKEFLEYFRNQNE